MSQSISTWVVVGDASGARIFKFNKPIEHWSLVEKVAGDAHEVLDATRDFGKKASEHKGALHGHGENLNAKKETAERRFAHLLSHVLERGLDEGAFARLVLVAEPKLLGELRENLSRGLQSKVVAELHKDLMHLTAEQIAEKLRPELPL